MLASGDGVKVNCIAGRDKEHEDFLLHEFYNTYPNITTHSLAKYCFNIESYLYRAHNC